MTTDAEERAGGPRSKAADDPIPSAPLPSKRRSSSTSTTSEPLPKSIDDKYDVVQLLGKGGMGAVYEATHRLTGRKVAIKVIVNEALAKEPEIISRFRREARASGTVDSQHVVQVIDTGVDATTSSPYMVMEHLAGEDLAALIHRLGPLPPALVINLAAQACLGLERAHAAHIVHRDIKSANIFLSRQDGGIVTVKILDFGIAKVRADPLAPNATSHHLTRTGTMLGSPLYMSPEQARGMKTLDGRADIWSLGVVMYEALTGQPPNAHCESLGELLLGICSEDSKRIEETAPWVPSALAAIVHKALTRDTATRYANAEEMHAALVALAPPRGISIHDSMITALPAELKRTTSSIPASSPAASTTPLSSLPKGATLSSEPALVMPPARAITGPELSTTPPQGGSNPLVSAVASTMSGIGQQTDPEAFRSSNPASSSTAQARSSSSKTFVVAGVVAMLLFAGVGSVAIVKSQKTNGAMTAETPTTPKPIPSSTASSAPATEPSVVIAPPSEVKVIGILDAAAAPAPIPTPAKSVPRATAAAATATPKPSSAPKPAESPGEPAIQRNF